MPANDTIDYYPFGMQMPGRVMASGAYRYGFGEHEKMDEIQGTGNIIDIGDRWLNVRLGRTPITDRLAKETPSQSPYIYAGNSPILFIDKNGDFKLKYEEELLARNGLTKQDVVRFEQIVNNVGNLVKNNTQALEAIANTTGFTKEQILKDIQPGEGPEIEILEYPGARGGASGIVFGVDIIKQVANIDPENTEELAIQALGTALTILHEYGHYADQVTNEGYNTGQYFVETRGNVTKQKYDAENNVANSKKLGSQKWRITLTGHRGTDIEVVGFGVQVSLDSNNRFNIENGKLSPTIPQGTVTVPLSLPGNAQGINILETLEVK